MSNTFLNYITIKNQIMEPKNKNLYMITPIFYPQNNLFHTHLLFFLVDLKIRIHMVIHTFSTSTHGVINFLHNLCITFEDCYNISTYNLWIIHIFLCITQKLNYFFEVINRVWKNELTGCETFIHNLTYLWKTFFVNGKII